MSLKSSGSSSRRTICIASSILFLIMMFFTPTTWASARNQWLDDDPTNMKSFVEKAVDPVFINFGGSSRYRAKSSLGIPIGKSWELDYFLEAGKRYHIFLVGDWICNETEPQTDYDIKTIYPDGRSQWNTESAGLPEQVANDGKHQYFIPPITGTYRFQIINDERDSKNTEEAIFMLLEHIDINVDYRQDLEGRNDAGQEVLFSGWAYEIDTTSPKIRIFVDVPDTLDMYESRLYMMANPNGEIGYNVSGLGVPTGNLFKAFEGQYGGFNTSCKGDRNIDAMASCEHSGKDMEFVYNTPNSFNDTGNIFYYLVLIAEHDKGTVEFYAQTDFLPPNVTLVEPPEIGYAGENTEIKASIEEKSEVQSVWAEYIVGTSKTSARIDFSLHDDIWVGYLPPFQSSDSIKYTIYATDRFGNKGSVSSQFFVKERTSIECTIDDTILVGNEKATISGTTSLSSSLITLKFTNGAQNNDFKVRTDENGYFKFIFAPDKTGEWKFQALFEGSATESEASSEIMTIKMESKMTHISNILSAREVKMNVPIVVQGSVSPSVAGLPVEILFVSASSSHTETVKTNADGSFMCSFLPTEQGTWNVLSKIGDGLYYARSQSELMEFSAVPLNIIDKIFIAGLTLVAPPLLYGTAGFACVILVIVLYIGRSHLAPILPKSLAQKMAKGKNNNKKSEQRYRRSKK